MASKTGLVISKEEQYKLDYVITKMHKLGDACKAKKERLKELKKGKGTADELDKLHKIPMSLLFVFNPTEEKRLADGLNPWMFQYQQTGTINTGKRKTRVGGRSGGADRGGRGRERGRGRGNGGGRRS